PKTQRSGSIIARVLDNASPFVAASMAVFALVALAVFLNRMPQVVVNIPVEDTHYQPVSPISLNSDSVAPDATATTKATDIVYSPTSVKSVSLPTAVTGQEDVFTLAQPRPVMESGDVAEPSAWHLVRDAAYGYSVSYPPNWWTHVVGQTRYFFPWGSGGTR